MIPPFGPCALRRPNYTHCFGVTAFTILLALVATSEAKPIRFKKGVSKSWIKPKGPV